MKITIYGSNLCPKTLHSIESITSLGIMPKFINVTGSINLLMDFVKLRDTNPLYDDIRGTEKIGFPTFELEDGTLTRDVDKVLEMIKAEMK